MTKLKLEFSSKRAATVDSRDPNIRVNLKNGNIKLSNAVVEAMGLKDQDTVNFSPAGGNLYVAQEAKGYTFSEKTNGFSSMLAANLFKSTFKKELGDDVVLYAGVDIENPIEAETEDGDITVYALSYMESTAARGSKDDGEEEEEEEEETAVADSDEI